MYLIICHLQYTQVVAEHILCYFLCSMVCYFCTLQQIIYTYLKQHSDIFKSLPTSGNDLSSSHFDTACLLTSMYSANSSCIIFCFVLSSASRSPINVLSFSLLYFMSARSRAIWDLIYFIEKCLHLYSFPCATSGRIAHFTKKNLQPPQGSHRDFFILFTLKLDVTII